MAEILARPQNHGSVKKSTAAKGHQVWLGGGLSGQHALGGDQLTDTNLGSMSSPGVQRCALDEALLPVRQELTITFYKMQSFTIFHVILDKHFPKCILWQLVLPRAPLFKASMVKVFVNTAEYTPSHS